jgi:hypothetical protein
MMGNMPAIPESTRSSITLRLIRHAREHWPRPEKLQVTCRGGFAYATAALPGSNPQPLFRLRNGGSAHSFGFARTPTPVNATKTPSCSPDPAGTPQEALDTACTLYYASPATNPAPDPRRTYGTNH